MDFFCARLTGDAPTILIYDTYMVFLSPISNVLASLLWYQYYIPLWSLLQQWHIQIKNNQGVILSSSAYLEFQVLSKMGTGLLHFATTTAAYHFRHSQAVYERRAYTTRMSTGCDQSFLGLSMRQIRLFWMDSLSNGSGNQSICINVLVTDGGAPDRRQLTKSSTVSVEHGYV